MERLAVPSSRAPKRALPASACDCHTHVFGSAEDYPLAATSGYPLPDADAGKHRQMLAETGLSRAILVQPAPYGDNCRAMTDAIAEAPDMLRGIGTAFAGTSRAQLLDLREAGVVGLRFVHLQLPEGRTRFAGAAGLDDLWALAPAMAEVGLHAQLWCDAATFAAHRQELARLAFPIVLEHMARFDMEEGIKGAAFQTVLAALAADEIWVKLALCRASQQFPNYPDARPFHDALLGANPAMLLWASDWPHVRLVETRPDVGHLLDLFAQWANEDDALIRQILVDNPGALYGFEPARLS